MSECFLLPFLSFWLKTGCCCLLAKLLCHLDSWRLMLLSKAPHQTHKCWKGGGDRMLPWGDPLFKGRNTRWWVADSYTLFPSCHVATDPLDWLVVKTICFQFFAQHFSIKRVQRLLTDRYSRAPTYLSFARPTFQPIVIDSIALVVEWFFRKPCCVAGIILLSSTYSDILLENNRFQDLWCDKQ